MTPRFHVLLGLALGTWAATTTAGEANPKVGSKADCRWSKHWRAPSKPDGRKATPPVKVRDVPIKWPQAAEFGVPARWGGKGTPVVQALIDERGRVADVRPIHRLRWQPPWPEFDEAVLEAVRQWEFEPSTLEGAPVQACLTVAVAVHWR